MNLAAINQTIEILCGELPYSHAPERNWQEYREEELLYDVSLCILSSQVLFEIAEAAANRLRNRRLFQFPKQEQTDSEYEREIAAALSEPLTVSVHGRKKIARYRFRHRAAAMLGSTTRRIYADGGSLATILATSESARHARARLIDKVCGFGPKQASLFLRRIGYCTDLAVLDTHILDYLWMAGRIHAIPTTLSRLSTYEPIEFRFQQLAEEVGHPVGSVDLAMWVTMRVAKRERFA